MRQEGLGIVFERILGVFLFVGVLGSISSPAVAQRTAQRTAREGPSGVDQRILAWVNGADNALLRAGFGVVDHTAYPAFYGGIPIAWVGPSLSGKDSQAAARLTVTMIGTFGVTKGLKLLLGRDRPNAAHAWVRSRPEFPGGDNLDPDSWPSGHAAMAAAMATSLALTYRSAYVVVPAVVWAGAVGVSRIWLGVHYPSDVLSGWVLGTAVALSVHAISNNRGDGSFQGGPLLKFSIPL